MRVYGQLEFAQMHQSIPASIGTGKGGQFYADITTPAAIIPKFYDGTSFKSFFLNAQTFLTLAGSASGLVTVQTQAAAGTYNFNLPTTAGNAGQALLSGGGGAAATTWGYPVALFGDGSDGDLTVTSSTTTSGPITNGVLTRDAFFRNLTISGAGAINTGACRLFVSGTLDLTNASVNSLNANGFAGNNATSSAGAGTSNTQAFIGTCTLFSYGTSLAGATGGTGAGVQAGVPGTAACSNGGAGGGVGAAGTGSSGAGGAAHNGTIITATNLIRRYETNFLFNTAAMTGAGRGAGGSSGGGDGSASGGGGGSSGNAGGPLMVYAFILSRGASTAVGALSAKGGLGGNGFTTVTGSTGGGGGAGGGGGGWIYLVYGSLLGTAATNMLDASGGLGGNGGGGTNAAGGAAGGTGGSGGRATTFCVFSGLGSELFGSAGTAGTAGSGTAGGPGGAGNTVQVSL